MIKDENLFDNYMTIWEKVINVIKQKFNSELIYNRKYLKAEKRFNTKERFQCFYIPVILFDSVYRKDGKYYRKVFLEKFILNFFRGFLFSKCKKSFLLRKYKKFLWIFVSRNKRTAFF